MGKQLQMLAHIFYIRNAVHLIQALLIQTDDYGLCWVIVFTLVNSLLYMYSASKSSASNKIKHGIYPSFIQGIVYLNRNGNFCEETWIFKIITRAKVDARAAL